MPLNKETKPNKTKPSECQKVGFAVTTDHKVKIKESEKSDMYQDLARE